MTTLQTDVNEAEYEHIAIEATQVLSEQSENEAQRHCDLTYWFSAPRRLPEFPMS